MAPPKGGYAPSMDKFLDTLKSRPVDASIEFLSSLIKRRQIQGSEDCALATAHILLQVVARDKWSDVDQLVRRIQYVGRRLVASQPRELVIGNIVRRVLGLIRDEASEDRNEGEGGNGDLARETTPSPAPGLHEPPHGKLSRVPTLTSLSSFTRNQSMFNILSNPEMDPQLSTTSSSVGNSGATTPLAHAQATNVHALRSEVIDGIEEIMDEIKQVDDQVQAFSEVHIHPRDYILVHQPSRTVQRFLIKAAKRRFTVFLAVDPSSKADDEDPYAAFRKSLASGGSVVVNIMNTGLMAYMSKVNKVILGARAITAKGGVVVDSGAAVIARAACEQGRTVIVIGGVYKLSPDSQYTQESLVEWGDPSKYVSYSDGALVGGVRVKNAVSEFVPAEMVNTYITNLGVHSREQLHTVVADHYKDEDIKFDLFGRIHP